MSDIDIQVWHRPNYASLLSVTAPFFWHLELSAVGHDVIIVTPSI